MKNVVLSSAARCAVFPGACSAQTRLRRVFAIGRHERRAHRGRTEVSTRSSAPGRQGVQHRVRQPGVGTDNVAIYRTARTMKGSPSSVWRTEDGHLPAGALARHVLLPLRRPHRHEGTRPSGSQPPPLRPPIGSAVRAVASTGNRRLFAGRPVASARRCRRPPACRRSLAGEVAVARAANDAARALAV